MSFLIEHIEYLQPGLLVSLRCSCIYWVVVFVAGIPSSAAHLVDLQDGGSVDTSFRQKYLYWLESMILCKNMSKGVALVERLEGLIHVILEIGRTYDECMLTLARNEQAPLHVASTKRSEFLVEHMNSAQNEMIYHIALMNPSCTSSKAL